MNEKGNLQSHCKQKQIQLTGKQEFLAHLLRRINLMVMGATRKDQGWSKVAVYLTALTDQPYPALRNHGSSGVTDPLVHGVEVTV